MTAPGLFSSLIVYVDESGDHGPVSPEFPRREFAVSIVNKTERFRVGQIAERPGMHRGELPTEHSQSATRTFRPPALTVKRAIALATRTEQQPR